MRDDDLVATAIVASVRRADWIRANCPLCVFGDGRPDRGQSLSVSAKTGWYRCWACAATGRIDIVDAPGVWAWDADAEHADLATRCLDSASGIKPPPGFIPLGVEPGLTSPLLGQARDYLVSRGLDDPWLWWSARIGCTVGGWARDRVVVPVVVDDKWRGWVGRRYRGDHPARYLYPRGMPRGRVLYNQDAVGVVTKVPLLVVEGVFDALPYWPDAVATLGKATAQHRRLLAATTRRVVVAYDGDAWREGRALAQHLAVCGVDATSIRLPPAEDPGSVVAWLRAELRHA